jgi:hypothetical protein
MADSLEDRLSAAERLETEAASLIRLAGDAERLVRDQVVRNPSSPPEALALLAQEFPSLIVLRPDAPPKALVVVAGCNLDWHTLSKLVEHPNTPSEALGKFVDYHMWDIRRSVAEHPNASADSLAHLARDSHSDVVQAVYGNPNTSKSTRDWLSGQWVGRRHRAADPTCVPGTLARLAEDESVRVRMAVASNPNAGPETLRLLAQDNNSRVLEHVARNPNTSADVLMDLAKDRSYEIQRAVLDNPTSTDAVRLRIAGWSGTRVATEMARDPRTGRDLLEELSRRTFDVDTSFFNQREFYSALANNPNTSFWARRRASKHL